MSAERPRRRATWGATRGGNSDRVTSTATYATLAAAIIAAISSISAAFITVRQAAVLQSSGKVLEFHKERIDKLKEALSDHSLITYDNPFPPNDWKHLFVISSQKYKECYGVYQNVRYLIDKKYQDELERDYNTIKDTVWITLVIDQQNNATQASHLNELDIQNADGEKLIAAFTDFCGKLHHAVIDEMTESAHILSTGTN